MKETDKLFATEIARLAKLRRTDSDRWRDEVVLNKAEGTIVQRRRRRPVRCGKGGQVR
jgi:hypothetical protein